MQSMEGQFDSCTEQLFEVSLKLEENDKLENQLKDDKFTLAESERKYEDIARKLATKEDELERSNERCTNGEKKIIDLEEELK